MISKCFTLLAVFSLFACSQSETQHLESDICEAATTHLVDCLGTSSPVAAGCDESVAQEILDTDCSSLTSSDKEDGFLDSSLCKFGWLSHCEMPVCEAKLETESSCSDYLSLDNCGACDYYDCREAESVSQCGDDGYYVAFGAKNCRTLTQLTGPSLSRKGQRWLAATRQCLLEYVESEISLDADCETIMQKAMDSHVDCYVDSGFCEMSVFDKRKLGKSISVADLDFDTIAKTELKCAKKIITKE